MVISYMVKSHIWSILSWSKVGSFINKIDRIYGQSLIWSILGGQNRGPYGRYTLYWSIVRPLDISSSDFITSSVLTSHRYYCSFAAIPLQKIPIYLLIGQIPNALSTAPINPTCRRQMHGVTLEHFFRVCTTAGEETETFYPILDL